MIVYGGHHFVNFVTRPKLENTNLQDLVKCLHLKTVKARDSTSARSHVFPIGEISVTFVRKFYQILSSNEWDV